MLFDDGTTLALSRALDGVSLRQRVTANNMANAMTPGFKASRVEWEDSLAGAVAAGDPASARAEVVETGGAAREDGNNVDAEGEMSSLMKSGLQFQAAAQAMTFKYSVLRTAIKG